MQEIFSVKGLKKTYGLLDDPLTIYGIEWGKGTSLSGNEGGEDTRSQCGIHHSPLIFCFDYYHDLYVYF